MGSTPWASAAAAISSAYAVSRSWLPRSTSGCGAGAGSVTGGAGSGCGTSSASIFSTRFLSSVTSPPDRSVKTTESPTYLWFFTDTVRPELMKTISAEARDEPAATSTHVATASRTILSTIIGTRDPTIWLAVVSRNYT